jgi:hypothetical protein
MKDNWVGRKISSAEMSLAEYSTTMTPSPQQETAAAAAEEEPA